MRGGRRLIGATCVALLSGLLTSCSPAPPQIISIDPNRGTTSVAADQPITVVFDRAVDRASLRGRFGVSPSLPGCDMARVFDHDASAPCGVQWLVGRPGFIFLHGGAVFAPATRYTFSLGAGVRDTAGVVNSLDHHWDITSQTAPQVTATTPGAGSAAVPIDAPMSVEFDREMASVTTATAIALDPPVPGLGVVRDATDPARFDILPGRLLRAHTHYTLSVDTGARDVHGQRLATRVVAAFTTGTLSGVRQLAALSGPQGGAATRITLIPATTGAGTVPAAVTVLDVGGVGQHLTALDLGPGAAALAVVQRSADPAAPPLLRVIDVPQGSDAFDVSGADLPAWSAQGDLAYAIGGVLTIRSPNGVTRTFAAVDGVVAAPQWAPDGQTVAVTRTAGSTTTVELVAPALGASTPIAGLPPGVSVDDPVFAPDGSALAVHLGGARPGTWVASLQGGGGAARIDAAGAPVGFTDAATVLVAETDANGGGVLTLVPSGGGNALTLPGGPAAESAGITTITSDGRQIAYAAFGGNGGVQAWIENGDGSGAVAMTDLGPSDAVAALSFSP